MKYFYEFDFNSILFVLLHLQYFCYDNLTISVKILRYNWVILKK